MMKLILSPDHLLEMKTVILFAAPFGTKSALKIRIK